MFYVRTIHNSHPPELLAEKISLRDTPDSAALTKAPPEYEVVTAEFKINLMRPAIGDRFLAIGKVQSSGKLLTVCTGEVRAFTGTAYKVIALMQTTIVNVRS